MTETKTDFKKRVKGFFSKTVSTLNPRRLMKRNDYHPELTENGLLTDISQRKEQINEESQNSDNAIVRSAEPAKNEQLEKLQEGFNQLIGQLGNINQNLSSQLTQHQALMERLDKLPEMLENFAPSIDNQTKLTEQMLENLKSESVKNQQFSDSVEKIPVEIAKQTDALENIDQQLAAAADSDVRMAQSFDKFRNSIEKLDQSTGSQRDSIMQMSKTFAASDRYLKYIIARDKKRMFWLFVTSLSVCAAVVLILTGIIIYLSQ